MLQKIRYVISLTVALVADVVRSRGTGATAVSRPSPEDWTLLQEFAVGFGRTMTRRATLTDQPI